MASHCTTVSVWCQQVRHLKLKPMLGYRLYDTIKFLHIKMGTRIPPQPNSSGDHVETFKTMFQFQGGGRGAPTGGANGTSPPPKRFIFIICNYIYLSEKQRLSSSSARSWWVRQLTERGKRAHVTVGLLYRLSQGHHPTPLPFPF